MRHDNSGAHNLKLLPDAYLKMFKISTFNFEISDVLNYGLSGSNPLIIILIHIIFGR